MGDVDGRLGQTDGGDDGWKSRQLLAWALLTGDVWRIGQDIGSAGRWRLGIGSDSVGVVGEQQAEVDCFRPAFPPVSVSSAFSWARLLQQPK